MDQLPKDHKKITEVNRKINSYLKFIRYKDESIIQKIIGKIVWIFNKRYMTDYASAMFGKIWLPEEYWFSSRRTGTFQQRVYLLALLEHEMQHLRDRKKFWLFFSLSYFFLLPVLFTFRSIWERRAYKKTLDVMWYYGLHDEAKNRALKLGDVFTGPEYLFMSFSKKRVVRYFQGYLGKLWTADFISTRQVRTPR